VVIGPLEAESIQKPFRRNSSSVGDDQIKLEIFITFFRTLMRCFSSAM
jgi:hypothetical protein